MDPGFRRDDDVLEFDAVSSIARRRNHLGRHPGGCVAEKWTRPLRRRAKRCESNVTCVAGKDGSRLSPG